jgi:hypothetical protein
MRATKVLLTALLAVPAGRAQVLAPEEIADPQLRALQQKYFSELKQITSAARAHSFPYHFYFSRKLDLEEKDQPANDQRSVQFDRYQGQVVLKITGNYFASYSAELMKPDERARQTYQSVILPLLQAAVPALAKADAPAAFAFEISHHMRRKVLGVPTESAENVVLILPRASAQQLVASTDPLMQRAAVLEGEAFLNANPITFWPRTDEQIAQRSLPPSASLNLTKPAAMPVAKSPEPVVKPPEKVEPARDSSPDAIKALQKSHQAILDRMVQDMESQAHFVHYAPPAFVPFRSGIYLQVSLTTALPPSAAGSQYRFAAMAFDQHIAHLIRPLLANFKDHAGFDGIDFSTTVRVPVPGGAEADASAVAVEFITSFGLLNTYADFDLTGQQLIDGSFVLINGERVSLNLQEAEK